MRRFAHHHSAGPSTASVLAALAGRRSLTVFLWIGASAISAALLGARYRAAVSDRGFDFVHYFLPAGQLVGQGSSPYLESGYVYSPLVALLVSTIAGTKSPMAWWTLLNLSVGTLAVGLLIIAFWSELRPWHRPSVFTVAMVALFYNWPATLLLGSGQTDFFVLAGLALATIGARRRHPITAGLGVAWAGLMKTWPLLIGVWFLRRRAPRRGTTVGAALGLTAAVVGLTAVGFGPASLTGWIHNVAAARDQPGLIQFSVQHLGTQLFVGGAEGLRPVVVAPHLATVVNAAGVVAIVGSLVTCLVFPGDSALSLWHTTLLSVLLLPVSHSVYLIYGIPILLIWLVRTLKGDNRHQAIAILAGWTAWWVLCFRVQWPGDTFTSMSASGFATVMLSTVAMICWSVIAEARSAAIPKWHPQHAGHAFSGPTIRPPRNS